MKRPSFRLHAALVLAMASETTAVAQTSPFTNLNWQACAPGSRVQCATTRVPLDWSNTNGPQIDYFLRLYPAPMQPARRSIVYVAGGPGATGSGGAALAELQSV